LKSTNLKVLYSRFLERGSEKPSARCVTVDRDRARKLDRLQQHGVITITDLLERLPRLPPKLKLFGIQLVHLLKVHQAVPVLIQMMSDEYVRLACADTLSWMKPARKVTQVFVGIGTRELASPCPDRSWLNAVILGLHATDDRRAIELLVTIFERCDLPGWVRGDAADKLGCVNFVNDRRTRLFRRCRQGALRGLNDDLIDVQFGSMYLIGALCSHGTREPRANLQEFKSALPRLRQIAKNDQRLAPGYWWPMSAEAADVINCIVEGRWPDPDAGERWMGNTARGEWNRD
jgi:hypothetical protein